MYLFISSIARKGREICEDRIYRFNGENRNRLKVFYLTP